MKPYRVAPPAAEPVTLDEAKSHLRLSSNNEDVVIAGFISAAVAYLDGYSGVLGRAMITQQWALPASGWRSAIPLPLPDVSNVSVTYQDTEGQEQTVPTSLFEVFELHGGPVVRFRDGFVAPTLQTDTAFPVRITFDAGYGADPEDVPRNVRHAILMMVAELDASRRAASDKPSVSVAWGVHPLIAPHRWRSL